MMTTYKSIHIKECWPYQYEEPERLVVKRRVHTREAMNRQNELKRAAYHRKKASMVKTNDGKKLLGLRVFSMSCDEMGNDICERLNNDTR